MAAGVGTDTPRAFDGPSMERVIKAVRMVLKQGTESSKHRRRWPVPDDVADISIVWGILLNDLANNARVELRVQTYNENTQAWEDVSPEKRVNVTARNVPEGKKIPKDSSVGASQIGDNIYCVLVSDCPKAPEPPPTQPPPPPPAT